MKQNNMNHLARVLRVLVTITFLCNLLVLPFVPGLVFANAQIKVTLVGALLKPNYFFSGWLAIWADPYTTVLTCFLIFCGGCTAVLLWQARRILGTVFVKNTFCMRNAHNMTRAAVCCFLISGAAFARTIFGFFHYRSLAPLFTYNALFVPIFLMGGLLCMVMSALFRQAADLKEENDLTI